ncbi:tyrosine-type recombinase/integrase [Acidipila rosea]|uniref:Integrase n=1 Tax=Acidipila rosea TaxID=768535 RepID=A0A4R1L367_9BACT|nr:integrase arm-type DNA-binding domain-containing protein [Acidipila rosea]TCK72466.1 integrase [Acidipila rosea]
MPANLLTALDCKNAACTTTTIRKLSDGDGLYLWVYREGKKHWRFRYWQDGKEKSLLLGTFPLVSLKEARAKRETIRKQLQSGADPSAERKAEARRKQLASANSFEAVAREWFGKQSATWVASHTSDVRRRLEANIFPLLGSRPIAEIDAPELLAAIRNIESRGSYDLAHRVLQVCGQVFRYGIATGRCSRNPAPDLCGALAPHVKQHQPAVRPEEFPELVRKIATYDEIGDRQTRLALQLLALTFVRTNELIGATWAELDLEQGLWVIPAERMKMRAEHIVPLARQTVVLLEELKPLAGTSRYLLPGRNAAKSISNNTMLFALYRLGYRSRMTGHGFRAVASTILNESGFRPDVIERQLAHCERNAVRGAYNRAEYLPERKRMMQWWADHIDGIVTESKVLVGNFGNARA